MTKFTEFFSDDAVRRDVIGRYRGLSFEPRLKVTLLSCTVGMVSLIAGCVGTSGLSQDSAAVSTQWTELAATQPVDECLRWEIGWEIACQLEQPVGTAGGDSEAGPGDDRTSDGGGSDGGTSDGGGSDGGTSDGGTSDGGGSDGGTSDGGSDKGHGNGDENDSSADNGAGNTDADNPGKGGRNK